MNRKTLSDFVAENPGTLRITSGRMIITGKPMHSAVTFSKQSGCFCLNLDVVTRNKRDKVMHTPMRIPCFKIAEVVSA